MTATGMTVRVFISSTFRDMHAERDYLTRVGFPELRARLAQLGVNFVDIDLRWGITQEEAESSGALEICLDEIERCRPYFVCLLGHRYGWVPPPEELSTGQFDAVVNVAVDSNEWPVRIKELYAIDSSSTPPVYRLRREARVGLDEASVVALCSYLESHGVSGAGESITAREILRGTFEPGFPATHSLFYLRHADAYRHQDFPASMIDTFVDPQPAKRERLNALKERIRASDRGFLIRDFEVDYEGLRIEPTLLPRDLGALELEAFRDGVIEPHEWEQLSPDVQELVAQHGTVTWGGLAEFSTQVIEDLWEIIQRDISSLTEPVQLTKDAVVTEQEQAIWRRFQFFVGRTKAVEELLDYVANSPPGRMKVIAGASGTGKSALMAEFSNRCRSAFSTHVVLPQFVGATANSQSIVGILQSVCKFLQENCNLEKVVSDSPEQILAEFPTFLREAGAIRPVIILLDAVDQLDETHYAHEFSWIPRELPDGVRLIVSVADGPDADRLRQVAGDEKTLEIGPLSRDEQEQLMEDYLAERRKRLTSAQIDRLLDTQSRPDSGLPLYLIVALEELCYYGDFATLDRRIDGLPPTLPDLLEQVLLRVEHDHGPDFTETLLSWLAVSRSGLGENTVLDLLRHRDDSFPIHRWTRFVRSVDRYVTTSSNPNELLRFVHRQFVEAAKRRYFQSIDQQRVVHRELGEHFLRQITDESSGWRDGDLLAWNEVVYHLSEGRDYAALARLADQKFLDAMADRVDAVAALEDGRTIASCLADQAKDYWPSFLAAANDHACIVERVQQRLGNCVALVKAGQLTRVMTVIEQERDASRRAIAVLAVSSLLESMNQPESASRIRTKFPETDETDEHAVIKSMLEDARHDDQPPTAPVDLPPPSPTADVNPARPREPTSSPEKLPLLDEIAVIGADGFVVYLFITIVGMFCVCIAIMGFAKYVLDMSDWPAARMGLMGAGLLMLPLLAMGVIVLLRKGRIGAHIQSLTASAASTGEQDAERVGEAIRLYKPYSWQMRDDVVSSLESAISRVMSAELDPILAAQTFEPIIRLKLSNRIYRHFAAWLHEYDPQWISVFGRELFRDQSLRKNENAVRLFAAFIPYIRDAEFLAMLMEAPIDHACKTARSERKGDAHQDHNVKAIANDREIDQTNLDQLSQADPKILAEAVLARLDGVFPEPEKRRGFTRTTLLEIAVIGVVVLPAVLSLILVLAAFLLFLFVASPLLLAMCICFEPRNGIYWSVQPPERALNSISVWCRDLWGWCRKYLTMGDDGTEWRQAMDKIGAVSVSPNRFVRFPFLCAMKTLIARHLVQGERLPSDANTLAGSRRMKETFRDTSRNHLASAESLVLSAMNNQALLAQVGESFDDSPTRQVRAITPEEHLQQLHRALPSQKGESSRRGVFAMGFAVLVGIVALLVAGTPLVYLGVDHTLAFIACGPLPFLFVSAHLYFQVKRQKPLRGLKRVILPCLGMVIALFFPVIVSVIFWRPESFATFKEQPTFQLATGYAYMWLAVDLLAWVLMSQVAVLFWRGANLLYPTRKQMLMQRMKVLVGVFAVASLLGVICGIVLLFLPKFALP